MSFMASPLSKKDFLSLLDFSKEELCGLLQLAHELKQAHLAGKTDNSLQGKVLGMIFEKASTRTRVSFEVAMVQLGGQALYIDAASSQLGRGESIEDTGRVLSRYVQGLMYRTFSQNNLASLAKAASVPVINGLTDLFHPVQLMADLLTIIEVQGRNPQSDWSDLSVTYVGDGNNLANSWINAAMIFGFELKLSCPAGHEPSAQFLKDFGGGLSAQANIQLVSDPQQAVAGAHVVYTDTWFSMGQEVSDKKRKTFEPYQVNQELLSGADAAAIVLHCLPAHREEEITSDVLVGPQSRVWDQAENRLHAQKALLKELLS